MSEIKSFDFNTSGIEEIKAYKYGSDWPIVYLIENKKELYVGETIRAYGRTRQHLDNEARKSLKTIHIISDDEANKSSALDTESSLIEYLVADGKYTLQNGNGGLQNHNYFDREKYQAKFEVLWVKLQKMGIAKNDLLQIRNSDLFKYSPYKTLTDDQYLIATELLKHFKENKSQTYVIHGGPGTGKTILATFLIKQLVEEGKSNVALVIAMMSLRKTIQNVFRSIPGLSSAMVIGPNDVTKKEYDVLIVDESHRLRRRRNIPNFGSFDKTNKIFGLDNEGTELDWILKSAKQVVLFYDAMQSVKPSDIPAKKISDTNPIAFQLETQLRVKGGAEYIEYIDNLLEVRPVQQNFSDYDFKHYDDIKQMVIDIKKRNDQHSLCRIVAGYAWKWVSRGDMNKADIEIDGQKLRWNSVVHDWVNSPNALNEVGCIHTIQGYDLNYTGVIIGPELSFNPEKNEIVMNRQNYKDVNGHRGVEDTEELKRYVINIYKTLLTRGILGTYVYACDPELRCYLKRNLTLQNLKNTEEPNTIKIAEGDKISPYVEATVSIPLFNSIGCGESMLADSSSDEEIEVPSRLIKPGAKYFALYTRGDSMNKLGIEDGDIILCQKNYQASSGSVAVVLIGDDATLKQIKYEKDGLLLIPRSSNASHQIKKLTEADGEFKVLGTLVCKIDL